jgi:hypothetical protein
MNTDQSSFSFPQTQISESLGCRYLVTGQHFPTKSVERGIDGASQNTSMHQCRDIRGGLELEPRLESCFFLSLFFSFIFEAQFN